jgi:hypothetical protein
MPQWVAILLVVSAVFFVLVVVPALVYIIVQGVRLWKKIMRLETSVGMPLEQLLFELETISVRAELATQRQLELEQRIVELQDAIEKIGVLQWALADARDSMDIWRTIKRR